MTRQGVIDTVKGHLVSYVPSFSLVVAFEPTGFGPMGGPYAAFWYAGEVDHRFSLKNVIVDERFVLRMYWRQVAAAEANTDLALEMWDAVRGVKALLRGDSTLGGNCTDMELTDSRVGIAPLNEGIYNVAEFEVHLLNMEAESISE